MNNPPIIIGCSGSTGSSLLKTILNRHPQIFAGPETNLFAFPQVYDDWDNSKTKLQTNLFTDGWAIWKGMDLLQPAYQWQATELIDSIQQAADFAQFVSTYFQKPLQAHQKQYWVEKSPVNAYGFQAFLEHYPTGKVIQIVRNPYDTVTSLIARGRNAYWAAGYYVYNTAIATSSNLSERYYQLKYEELVAQPRATLKALFHFLEIPFDANILEARHEKRAEPTTMKGWQHHETAAVKKSSVGRFQTLPLVQQRLIQTALASFQIHPTYLKKHQIRFATCEAICEELGYDFDPEVTPSILFTLRKSYWRDRLGRLRHQGLQTLYSYPSCRI